MRGTGGLSYLAPTVSASLRSARATLLVVIITLIERLLSACCLKLTACFVNPVMIGKP